jgi:hypothetical protein
MLFYFFSRKILCVSQQSNISQAALDNQWYIDLWSLACMSHWLLKCPSTPAASAAQLSYRHTCWYGSLGNVKWTSLHLCYRRVVTVGSYYSHTDRDKHASLPVWRQVTHGSSNCVVKISATSRVVYQAHDLTSSLMRWTRADFDLKLRSRQKSIWQNTIRFQHRYLQWCLSKRAHNCRKNENEENPGKLIH